MTFGMIGAASAAYAGGNIATLVSETFTGATLQSGPWALPATGNGLANSACLTTTASSSIAPCSSANGSVAGLQLTNALNTEEGGAAYGLSLPTVDGLDATFNSYQFGGDGADGINFFLAATNPSDPHPPTLGPNGGALGYATNGGVAGMSDGYLGFGLDVYGNYDNSNNGGGCSDHSVSGGRANQVDVRGPGNGTSGYCDLASTYNPSTGSGLSGYLRSDPATAVPVEVALNPSASAVTTASGLIVGAGSWAIAVQPVSGGASTVSGCPSQWQCLFGSLPNASTYYTSSPGLLDSQGVPLQLSFGWEGSTGAVNDYHVVNDLKVTTLTGIPPTYAATLSDDSTGGQVAPGQQVTYTATANLTGTAERDAVTVTDNLPTGLTADPSADTVSDGGAGGSSVCSSTQPTCTYTPPSGGLPTPSTLTAHFKATVASLTTPQAIANAVTFSSGDGFPASATDTVTFSGAPAVTASLATSSPTVSGVEVVSPSALPASSVESSSTTAAGGASSAPLGSIALNSSPLGSIPLGSIPLGSIALPGSGSQPSGLAAAQGALASTLLSDLSITYPAGCGTPPALACTGWNGILAGSSFQDIPLESVTLADVLNDPAAGPRFESVSIESLNLSSSPLGSIPLGSIELGGTALSSLGLDGVSAGNAAISAWCSELVLVNFSCADFGIDPNSASTTVTPLTLALAGVPLGSIPLGSIPLGSIPLGSIPLGSIPLGSIDLASNPLGSIPLGSIPLGSIPLGSIPLGSIPLGSIPLGSIPLGSIPLGSIPLGSIPLGSIGTGTLPLIVDCTNFASLCTSSTATLGDALAQKAILSSATLAELGTYNGTTLADLGSYNGTTLAQLGIYGATTVSQLLTGDNTSFSGYPSLTLDDLVLSTVPPTSYNWQAVDLAGLPLAAKETMGGAATYTATINVANSPTSVEVALTLPPTFAYVPHSAFLDGASLDPTSASALTWALPQLSVGQHQLVFQANAGIGLGPATATIAPGTSGTSFAPVSATIDVVDGRQPQISSATTAVPLSAGTLNTASPKEGDLNIGYLSSQGGVNDWSVSVPQNAELSLALTNLPGPYDLEVFGPGGAQLQGAPTQNVGGVTDTLPSLTPGSTTEATPGSQDIPVTPPSGDQLLALSNNPDGQSQFIQTPPLAAGTYIVQVSGYNGAFSSQPYLLQANLLGGAPAPSCPNAISYLGSLSSYPAATGPVSIPSGVNTVFLVNTQRLAAAFGATAEGQIMTNLQAVVGDSGAGVNGAIVPVDSYTSVQNAYSTWNNDPCSVPAANAVASAISSVVDQLRAANPTLQNVVVIGADDQIPFARVADGASQSNERDYGASTFAGENNVEADALSLGYYFSDDPYSASRPLGVGSATLYLPELGEGRLVESAAQIESALSRFVTSNGNLNADHSLTTGYSFLSSGAQAVSANLATGGLTPSTLINDTWQKSDLDTALATNPAPGVDSINAHFDFSRALPASGNSNGDQTNLFTTGDVRNPPYPTSYDGRLLFSMGCHAGLDITDAEVSASGIKTPVDDWAKTFADSGALWVANTGYGYADTDTVAYSARLMAGFAANLTGPMTIGQALSEAKQQYAAGNAILSPYDLKALMESTFYGLPMYHLNQAGPAAGGATNLTASPDQVTGQPAVPVSVSLSQSPVPTANGSYYHVNGVTSTVSGVQTGLQATEYRPIEPLVKVPVTASGMVAHGALVTSLSSQDVPAFTPVYSKPAVGSADTQPPSIANAAFPGTLQRVASYGTFTSSGTGQADQLDLVAGQFIPGSVAGVGTQRVFQSVGAQVFYDPAGSALASDYTPPTIVTSLGTASSTGTTFDVQVSASGANDPVSEVVVLYSDGAQPGTWAELRLGQVGDSSAWTANGASEPSGDVQYIVEALDAAGNVATSNNEGADFHKSSPPPITISVSGAPQVNGFFSGPISVNVVAPQGTTYVLDGSSPAPLPADNQITVSSPGEHIVTVTDPDGNVATQAFAISNTQTTTTLASDANPAVVGQPISLTATVAPATPGPGTPNGSVEFLDGGTPISACGGPGGVPVTGNSEGTATATCQLSYSSPASRQIGATYVPSGGFAGSDALPLSETVSRAGSTVNLSSSANPSVVGQVVTYTVAVGVAAPGSGQPTGYVEFLDGTSPLNCAGSTTVALHGGTATCATSYSSPGSHQVTAQYLGDATIQGGPTSTAVNQAVGQAATTTALSLAPNPAVVGQQVTYTATVQVAAPGSGTPTGRVEFLDGGTAIADCGGIGGTPMSGTVAVCHTSYPGAGTHQITAKYLGDGNFSASIPGADVTETVNTISTTTTLSSSDTAAVVGEPVTYTATLGISGAGSGTPTGAVEFTDGTNPIAGCGGASGVQSSGGTATCQVTYSSPGTHSVTATYLGNGTFAGSATSTPVGETVSKAVTTTALTTSTNPTVVGQAVTLNATVAVTSPGAAALAANVEFFDGPTPIGACGGSTGVQPIHGVANCTLTYGSPGTHQLTAAYLGDANLATSTTTIVVTQTVNQAATTTSLVSLTNPSVVGQPVHLSATVHVSAPGSASPSGNVEFLDNSMPIGACGGSAGEPAINGVATCFVTYWTPGPHPLTATYLGDPNLAPSATTTALTQNVGKAATATSLVSSTNPSIPGQAVTLTATVGVPAPGAASPSGSTPSGYVEFLDNGAPIASCGGTTGEPLGADLTATCSPTFTAAGAHPLTAMYIGDGNFSGSTSAPPVSQKVTNVTATALTTSANPTLANQSVTFKALVSVSSPGTGTPTGNVEFVDSGSPISACGGAAGVALSAGAATCKASFPSTGAHNVVAKYLGTTFSLTSSSPVLSEIVTSARCNALKGCNLQGLNLSGANLAGLDLSGSNLQYANLQGANLVATLFPGANLQGTNLIGVVATGADLAGANVSYANLTNADFTNANLTGANLSYSTLRNTNFTGANLSRVNFTGATY